MILIMLVANLSESEIVQVWLMSMKNQILAVIAIVVTNLKLLLTVCDTSDLS